HLLSLTPPTSTCPVYSFLPLLPFAFFFTDPPPTHIYTLSLHDALPISLRVLTVGRVGLRKGSPYVLEAAKALKKEAVFRMVGSRSEEHTSELQSHLNLVCRLLLEKKKQ